MAQTERPWPTGEPDYRLRYHVALALAVALATTLAVVGSALVFELLPAGGGPVNVSGATFAFVYTDQGVGAPHPVGGSWSWGGSSPYPLSGRPGSSGSFFAQLADNSTTNCTLWSISVGLPFELVNFTVADNATHWAHGTLPTTILGEQITPDVTYSWDTLLNLNVKLPSSGGTYLLPLSATVTC